jgi:hypothetical protein
VADLRRYCSCGASIRGRVEPATAAAGIQKVWDTTHGSPGHASATAAQAAAARRRAERAAEED